MEGLVTEIVVAFGPLCAEIAESMLDNNAVSYKIYHPITMVFGPNMEADPLAPMKVAKDISKDRVFYVEMGIATFSTLTHHNNTIWFMRLVQKLEKALPKFDIEYKLPKKRELPFLRICYNKNK